MLVAADDHPVTADDPVAAVHRSAPAVHRSTVYRTPGAGEQAGVVDHAHLATAEPSITSRRPHHHLVGAGCGAVVQVPALTPGG